MLLLIDVGNTLAKWAIVPSGATVTPDGVTWTLAGEVCRDDMDLLGDIWQKALFGQPLKRILISNVAGPVVQGRIAALLGMLPSPSDGVTWFASAPSLAGVTNCYADVMQLGSDRFASLVGARALFPEQNLVVVTCGTATTIDTLTADGAFIGGMILPGLRLMAESLSGNTALLPEIGDMPEAIPPFAIDTVNAIRNGCMTAQAGAIERTVTVHARHLPGLRCVLSGGAASRVLPYLSIPAQIVDNLVLVGLHAVNARQYTSDPSC
ncbi:MAG: type III pantothenate kinase [Burkholderiaceae bacterium]|nr:type III pantothenate kinase [Burkholderiaceae bacterium]